jgi:N-acetylmuramoyl-L-alanine amidase
MKSIVALLSAVSLSLAGSGFALDQAPGIPPVPEEAKVEEAKPAQAPNPNWELVAIDGIEYVSGVSIARFYHFGPPFSEGGKVTLENEKVQLILTIGSDEVLLNGVKFKCTTKIRLHQDEAMVSRMDLTKLLDPVLRPGAMQGGMRDFNTVVIDPVFGGDVTGQENERGTEADFAFKIATKLKDELKSKNIRVELTRAEGENPDIGERVGRIRKFGEDTIVISLGFNSDAEAGGIRTRVMAPIGVPGIEGRLVERDEFAVTGNAHENLSIALATTAHSGVVRRLGKNTGDLGIVRSRLPLLKQLDAPAVFIECGSMAHPGDSRLIPLDAYQDAIADGLAEAVARYRAAMNK